MLLYEQFLSLYDSIFSIFLLKNNEILKKSILFYVKMIATKE